MANRYIILASACLLYTSAIAASEYNDPPSTYLGMELLEPDPDNLPHCQKLPLSENFSDASHYDGTSQLPIGWGTTGTATWRTASIAALPPYSGEYYMIAPESPYARDERAYTPFFNLEKGVTYTLSFYTHQEGTTYQDVTNLNTIYVKVGTQHDSEFLPVTIASITKNDKPGIWEQQSYTFSPAVSGPYCFCFELQGKALSGFAAIDYVTITSPKHEAMVEPHFYPHTIFTEGSGAAIAMGNDPVCMRSYTRNGSPSMWSADGIRFDNLPNGDALFYFDNSGSYDITLTASNQSSEESLTRTVNIEYYSAPTESLSIRSFNINDAKMISRGDIPSYPSDVDGLDYISGPNHYYSSIAEYFHVPWQAELTLNSIHLLLTNLRYRPVQSGYQGDKPFKIKIYGTDGDGHLDETKLLGQSSYKMTEALGKGGIGGSAGDPIAIKLQRPVKVTGPFFIVFEFSEELIIDSTDTAVGRSYASFGLAQNPHPYTTLYCKPYAVPPFCDALLDEWIPISDLDPNLRGFSLNVVLHASYKPGTSAVENIIDTEHPMCRLIGSTLEINNAPDAAVSVYNPAGQRLVMQHTSQANSSIDLSALSSGIYIVTVNNHTFRITK